MTRLKTGSALNRLHRLVSALPPFSGAMTRDPERGLISVRLRMVLDSRLPR
jgi:hypothetical protein